MKNTRFLFAFCLLGVLSVFLGAEDADTLYLSVETQVLVFDRFNAAEKLSDWAEENGGYFTRMSEESVQLRVPDQAALSLRGFLDNISETVLQYSQTTVDLREELLRIRSALEAREEILSKNLAYLNSSDVAGTLELEREIRRLMSEIDSYRGRLRRLEHDSRMALVNVQIAFQHQSIPDALPSNFAWINRIDFYSFMSRYFGNQRGFSLSPPSVDLPDGFALVDNNPEFRALSPEAVRLRVRKEKNYPEQSLEFWMETLETQLKNRGYVAMPFDNVYNPGSGEPFQVKLWAMPYGNQDYLYLSGLRLKGASLEILEMAGQAEFVIKYLGN